jgi:hypothetical protein
MGTGFSNDLRTKQVQPVHWVVLAIVTLLTTFIILIPIILFMLTKNGYTLLPTTGLLPVSYAWKRILDYFFPKKPQDYELEKEKIWAKALSRQQISKP